jgi:transposase
MPTDDDYRREFGSALYRSLFFRRQLSYKAQQMIVFRRYGSLRSFRRPVERICDISRDLRVAPSTVYQVL